MTHGDLVTVMLPGVQQFVGESRTTADVAASSRIMSLLVADMARALPTDTRLVFPRISTPDDNQDGPGVPNRLVAWTAAGDGEKVATVLAETARKTWRSLCETLLPGSSDSAQAVARQVVAGSVGFPAVRWVVVGAAAGDYRSQWILAVEAINGRRRIRDFPAYDQGTSVAARPAYGQAAPGTRRREPANESDARFAVCSVSGRWAGFTGPAPASVRLRRGEVLSAPALVKRAFGRDRAPAGGYPSTWSVATARFRRDSIDAITDAGRDRAQRDAVRAAVGELRNAVLRLRAAGAHTGSGRLPKLDGGGDADLSWLARMEGGWLFADNWSLRSVLRDNPSLRPDVLAEVCVAGEASARRLARAAAGAGLRAATPYLAVLVQDADHMGQRLAVPDGACADDLLAWHTTVSDALVTAAAAQRARLQDDDLLGWTVYAGGDDVLGFLPARSGLAAMRELNASFVTGTTQVVPGATASTALVYFHAASPLQSVLAAARELLAEAKRVRRPGLGVAALRRGGQRVRLVRGWHADPPAAPGTAAVTRLEILVGAMRRRLSGRLAASLERDHAHLLTLSDRWLEYELRRLVRRHTNGGGGGVDIEPETVAEALLSLAGRSQGGWQVAQAAVLARFVASVGG